MRIPAHNANATLRLSKYISTKSLNLFVMLQLKSIMLYIWKWSGWNLTNLTNDYMGLTNHVQNVMLLSKSAQLFAMQLY